MDISNNGINLIKQFEGCNLHAYKCPSGVWTVGYGHTTGVNAGSVISSFEAERLLRQDLKRFVEVANSLIKVPVNQNQFDALISLMFNIGVGAFKSSTLLKLLNNKDYVNAGKQFLRWDKGNNG